MTNTRNNEIDNTLKSHDKAINDIQAALSALMKQQEQSSKRLEEILKAVRDKSVQSSGSSFGSLFGPDADSRGSKPFRIGKIEFPKFSGDYVEGWVYRCEHFFTMDDTPDESKLRCAAVHLEGDALQWHRAYMKTRNATVAEVPWPDYVRSISARFSDALFEDPLEEKASQSPTSVVHKNGSFHDSNSISFGNGTKEQESTYVELPVSFVPSSVGEPLDQSIPQEVLTEAVTVSFTNLENEASVRSFEALGLIDSKTNICRVSNGSQTTKLLPRGLVNSGNLCFLNATLQGLLACSPFVHLLQELRMCNILETGYPTLSAFVEFISCFDLPSDIKKDDIFLETGKPLRPVMFEPVLNNFSPDMLNSFSGRPRQEDAQEFLSFVMHQMHDELLKFEGGIPIVNGGNVSLVSLVSDEDDDSWETVGPRNKTAITRTQSFIPSKLSAVFGGQLKSVVKARGNKPSATIQPFLLLHLNICPELVHTIEDALHLFSAPETLEGYRASTAGKAELVSASKSVKLLDLPEIMILHLMRFSYGSQGSTKLLKPVYFPLKLNLKRDLLVSPSPEGGRMYELVATITHHGREPSKGHYTADILHPSGKWLRYDDASVVAISTNKVLHDQAYVLFYKHL